MAQFRKIVIPSPFNFIFIETYLIRERLEYARVTGFCNGQEEVFELVKNVEKNDIRLLFRNFYFYYRGEVLTEDQVSEKMRMLLNILFTIRKLEKYNFEIVSYLCFPDFLDQIAEHFSLMDYLEKNSLVIWETDPITGYKFASWNSKKTQEIEIIKKEGPSLNGLSPEVLLEILRRIFVENLPIPNDQVPSNWSLVEKMIYCL